MWCQFCVCSAQARAGHQIQVTCDVMCWRRLRSQKKSSDFRDRISAAAAAAAATLRPKIYIYWLLSEFELIWKMCGRVIYCLLCQQQLLHCTQLICVPLYLLSANFFLVGGFRRVWCSRTGYVYMYIKVFIWSPAMDMYDYNNNNGSYPNFSVFFVCPLICWRRNKCVRTCGIFLRLRTETRMLNWNVLLSALNKWVEKRQVKFI